ncbi:MAG: beta-N-acetylhexosaminidase [Candidatus Pacebacteria bacterium]|nr:beta-N-acetylhexosaminidase [Candidatus Paceibacterota bacterium]
MKYNHKILFPIILTVILFIFSVSFAATINKTNKEKELRKMIGQMLVIGFRGLEANQDSYIVNEIKNNNIGGIILFDKDNPSSGTMKRNIESPEQTKKLIENIKKYSNSSIFIAVDSEGGYVNRLKEKYGFTNIMSAEKIGLTNNADTAKTEGQKIGSELKELGFNLDFAPVVDVNVNPTNPVIGYLERSFSDNPSKVFIYANKFIEGLHQEKIISAIKHFPGHGSSMSDSHLGMVDITNTYSAKELIPYAYLIQNGYNDIIMTAHIVNQNIDKEYPATLSKTFLQGLLRNTLKFKGVIISDDMQMGAITEHYGEEKAAVKAINAGCDMLIISNNIKIYDETAPSKTIDAIYQAVVSGEIDEKKIYESYNRIQKLKKTYSIN